MSGIALALVVIGAATVTNGLMRGLLYLDDAHRDKPCGEVKKG